MKIFLFEYDPRWPVAFEAEKRILLTHLASAEPVIEHIGSTAVPGLVAKPVIDIMIGLGDFGCADALVPQVQGLGYRYFPQYEDVMPYRRFFKKENGATATHHIHMVEAGSEFWVRHLLFRDYLRNNPAVAADYAALKRRLAHQAWDDSNHYADAKTEFIRDIEEKAADADQNREIP